MSQTTRLASFGPVLVVAAHPNPSRAFKMLIVPKYTKLVYVKQEINKKNTY